MTAVAVQDAGRRVVPGMTAAAGQTGVVQGHEGQGITAPGDATSMHRWEDDGGARESLAEQSGVAFGRRGAQILSSSGN